MIKPAAPVTLPLRPDWPRLVEEHHDLVVIGGGIHGAGVARAAALRGYRVAVIDRGDWAAGTSSRSSKLLHGGLRYLRQGSFRLVREALRERELHLRLAPGWARPLTFRVPPVPPGATPRWQVRAGIALYDLLTGTPGRSRFWDAEPTYRDAMVDDARFCWQLVHEARRHGAVAMNYTEWLEWVRQGDRIIGARVADRLSGTEGWLSATLFVNATGPWAGGVAPGSPRVPRLRLTRGSHVVLDRRADDDARLFFSPDDGRVLFLLPYGPAGSLLGTTDLDEDAPLTEPVADAEEIGYLRRAFTRQFPEWSHWRAVGVQCGLRPLLPAKGEASSVSREEKIEVQASGSLISVFGGKYTTYRAVAERVLDEVDRRRGREPRICPTRTEPIPGGEEELELYEAARRAFSEEDAVCLADVFYRRTRRGHFGPVDASELEQTVRLWRLRWGQTAEAAEREALAFRRLEERRRAPLSAWTS